MSGTANATPAAPSAMIAVQTGLGFAPTTPSADQTRNDPITTELTPTFESVYRSGRTFGIYYGNIPFAALSDRLSLSDPEFKYLEQFFDDAAAGAAPVISEQRRRRSSSRHHSPPASRRRNNNRCGCRGR